MKTIRSASSRSSPGLYGVVVVVVVVVSVVVVRRRRLEVVVEVEV